MKFKPIILLICLLAVIVAVNVTMAAGDERQVMIAKVTMSVNTAPGHPGTLLCDGDSESYWAIKPDSGGGWVELSLNQAALIYGLQLNGNLGVDAQLRIEYQQNGYWMPFLGGIVQTIPDRGIIDLSYDRVVSDKLRLRLTGPEAGSSRLTELKVLGQTAASVYHLIEPIEIKYSQDSFRTSPAKFLTDRNTYTSWRIYNDNGGDDSGELKDNPFFMADAFHHRKIRQTRTEADRQVELELEGIYRLNSINLYLTPETQGSIIVKTKTGPRWQTIGQISLAESGWQRIDLSQKQIDADRVLIELQEYQENQGHHGRKGRSDHQNHQKPQSRSGGIGEVEIWGYGAYTGARHQTLVSVPQPVTQALNYRFKIEEEGLAGNRLELAVAGEYSGSVTVELNGVPAQLQPTLKINGNTVYQYLIPETCLLEGENFIRVLPGDPTFTLLQLQVTESYGDGEVPLAASGLNDGLRLTPANENETDFDLARESFIEAVEIYAPSNLAATVSAKNGAGLVQLTQTETGDGYSYFQGGMSATGLNVINHTGLPLAEIRVLAGVLTDSAPEIKIIWPKAMDHPGKEIPECDNYYKEYVLGRIDNPEAQVYVNGKPAKQSGHYFWIRFNELNLNYGEANLVTVKAVDPSGREGSQQIEFFWGDTPEYHIDQHDMLYHTNKTAFTISGRVGYGQYQVLVDKKTVTVDPQRRFSTAVSLEEGFNLIPITFNYTEKGQAMHYTVYRRVVCESAAPKLYIDAPISGTYLNSSTVTVTGTVGGKDPSVRVNGLIATVENGGFRSLPVRLIEGKNIIKVEATDGYGRKTTETVTVYRDTQAPVIWGVIPANGFISNTAQVNVSGKVSDTSQIYVYVNGKLAPCLNGGFTLPLTLVEGQNQIKVTAVDQAGNSRDYHFKVTADTMGPLEFTPTVNPSGWTNNNRPAINFTATDENSGVDHYEIRVANGAWITPVVSPYRFTTAVPDGEQTVQVKAVDKAGNATIGEVKVYIDTVPPAVPDGFEAVAGIDYLTLKWNDPYGEVMGYQIERLPEFPSEKYRKINRTVKENIINQYTDQEVQTGQIYEYIIKAIDRAENISAASDIVSSKIGIASKPIEESGGKVNFDVIEITIPEQALEMQSQLTIEGVKTELPENQYAVKLGSAYDLKLYDQQGLKIEGNFKKPVTLKVKYQDLALPGEFDPGDLGIYWYNEEGGYWEKLDNVINDYLEQTLSVKILHFSKYQVMISKYVSPSLDSYYNMGVSPFQSYFNDNSEHVSSTSGSLTVYATDLKLPGRGGFDLAISRIYDSAAVIQEKLIESNNSNNTKIPLDTFGAGWSLNIPWIETNDKGKFIRLPEGQTVKIELKDGRFEYHEGIHFTVLLQDENYSLILKDGTRYEFDSAGRAGSKMEPAGKNVIKYEYNNREISRIIDSIGRIISFSYRSMNGKRVIEKIQTGGRTVQYKYPDSNTLEVYDPLNRKTTYRYQTYSVKVGDYAKWSNQYVITYRNSESLPQYDIGGRSVTTNRVKNLNLNLIKEVVYPTGATSGYQYSVKDQNHSESWDEQKHYFRDVPGLPDWIAEVEERFYGAVDYYGQKLLVDKHNLAGKETVYGYDTNVKSGSLRKNDFIPAHSYVLSARTKVGDRTTAESFRQLIHDGGYQLVEQVEDIAFYKGTLPVSTRVSLGSKEAERVEFEYNLPLRAVYREAHYRGGASNVTYETINNHDNWGNLTYRWDGSRSLEENWIYRNHSTIRTLVERYLQKNYNPVTQSVTTLVTNYQYDESLGKPTGITVNNGEEVLKTTFTYYNNGALHTQTEPNGLVTEISYDRNGAFPESKSVRGVRDVDGISVGDIVTRFYYNPATGMKEWEEDPLGKRTSYQYDALNRITKVMLPDDDTDPANNPEREYLFDDAKNTCEFINEKGQRTLFGFDGLGRLTRIDKFPQGLAYSTVSTVYHYNTLGQIDQVTDGRGFVTLYEYDGLNRITGIIYPEVNGTNPSVTLAYDDQSNTVTLTDENGGVTTERNDWAGRLAEAVQSCRFENTAEDYSWRFSYDSLGNTVREIDPLWNRTDRQYDSLSRLLRLQLPQDKLVLPGTGQQPQDHRPAVNYQYDAMGNQTAVISPNGFKTEFEYDLLGRKIKETTRTTDSITGEAATAIVKYYYDVNGNKVMTVDPNNGIWQYGYSARGYLLTETDPEGNTFRYRYDALGNKIAATDPRGDGTDGKFTTWYLYDDLNRLFRTVLPDTTPPEEPYRATSNYDNPYLEITYDEADNKLTERDANGMVTGYTYNARNWTLTISQNGQVITEYTYDPKGNPVSIKDAVNNVTTNHYDSLGRLRRTVYPQNAEKFEYDALGNRKAIEDGGGNRTYYYYSGQGWLTGVTDAKGNLTQYRYDPNGNRVSVITPNDAGDLTTTYRYDEANRLVESVNSLGLVTSYSYDPAGNRKEMRDPRGTRWVYQYEPNNLLKRLDLTGGEGATYSVEYSYDPAGNRKTVSDSNGSISYNSTGGVYQADPLNRVNSADRRFDGAEYRTGYRYDKAGLLTGIRYPEADGWLEYRYNGLNQLNEVVGFTKPQGISYYPDGMPQGINYQNNVATSFTYDRNRRLDVLQVNRSGKDLLKLDYEYYLTNNILSINDRTFEYDAVHQLTKAYLPGKFMEPTPAPGSTGLARKDCYGTMPLNFAIDPKALVSLDHSSSSIGLSFDGLTQIKKIILTPDEEHQTHRIADGTFEIYVSGDNVTYQEIPRESWEYQKSDTGEIALTFAEALTTRYLKLNVLFDERSPLFEPEEQAAQFLNEVARMLQVYQEADSRTEEYQYDLAGNRKRRDIKLVRTYRNDYAYYANSNRLKSDGEYAYSYDNAGNMIKKGNSYSFNGEEVSFVTSGEGVGYWEYEYDPLNRLVEVKKNGSRVAEYGYDPEGYRVVKRAKGETIHYVFEGTEPIFEKNITTGKIKSYVYALGKHLARVDGAIGESRAKAYYYHTDHLGSIKSVTDEAGIEVYNADYFAFGGKFGEEGDHDEPHGFTGKEYDPDTGLYYFNARWYDEEIGRFVSEDNIAIDPNNPMTLNLYMYCSNNPVNRIDPSGHMDYLSQSDDLGAGIINGIGDQIEGLKNAPEAIKTIAVSVIKGDITFAQLAEAGLEGVIGDYKYILENLCVFNPLQQNTDQEVYEMGKHVSGIVTDVALAATGAGAAKLFSVLSKTKSGAKVVKALKALSKTDEAAEVADDVSDLTKAINKVDDIKNKPLEKHHFSTNKNKTYTPQFEKIANKYGLDLDDAWNKDFMPHKGRHPNEYHDLMLNKMKEFDQIAKGDKSTFLKLYEQLKNEAKNNPEVLTKKYWGN